ncbi:PAS domain-containing sensor histidine kinase, partial [Arcobacter aquimarinus]
MKVSFYIKLFIAFVIFAILLLGFSSFAFNNFYTFHNEKKHKEQNYNILNHQEDIFKTYLKNYDEKLWLLKNTLSNFKDEEKKIEFLKIFLKEDKNIKLFKIVSLDANEKLKIEKQNDDINIYKPNQLKRIFTS